MHCGVMVTGYNQGDWERLLAEDYSRPPAVSDAANMDDTLYLGELVEPLGFDSIWATEHYGSAYSMQPNPLQYLAYWAGRTRRVDVGTAVIVAPWWNPVRLASEISMLDILLKGRRLHLGIGRGISPHEYASLGYPIGESHAYFYDVVKASSGTTRALPAFPATRSTSSGRRPTSASPMQASTRAAPLSRSGPPTRSSTRSRRCSRPSASRWWSSTCSTGGCPAPRLRRAFASLLGKCSPPCRPCAPRSIPPPWASREARPASRHDRIRERKR